VTLAAHPGPDLADDVEDCAPGEREEEQLQRVARNLLADDRAEEGGAAGDQPGDAQPAP
jgi:hypothetical protein